MASSRILLLPALFYVLAAATASAPPAPAPLPDYDTIDVPSSHALNLSANEEYWAERSESAARLNRAAYVADPMATMSKFNRDVLQATSAPDGARYLAQKRPRGPCTATNPIDRCWRCRPDWARDRKRLARCAMGFGHRATGGLAGDFYVVTDPSDPANLIVPRPGTLRHAVIQDRPLWITFARNMVIALSQELIVNSDKTLDGRGAQVHIVGAQITLQSVNNVIIHNLRIHDSAPRPGGLIRDSDHHFGLRGASDGDGISVIGSSNIWIDHVSMRSCADGLIDIVDGSTAITVSNGHFTKHDHVMLFGASDETPKDRIMQVTVAFNHFGKGLVQRMPRIRFGFAHVVNNDYTHWLMYAIGGSKNPTIISQGNRFRAVDDRNFKEVTKREYTPESESRNWVWKSQDDLFLNGAFFTQSGGQNELRFDKLDLIKARSGQYVGELTQSAGALTCKVGKKC